jgi:DASH complex subunit DAD4
MENPHEQAQNALLSRIINNMENLNESVVTVNKCLQEVNKMNLDSEIVSQMWENYLRNAEFNLEATGLKKDPL